MQRCRASPWMMILVQKAMCTSPMLLKVTLIIYGQPGCKCTAVCPASSPHPVLLLSSMRENCKCGSGGSPAAAEQTPELHTGYSIIQATERDLLLEPVKHMQQILGGACRLQGASCRTEQAHCTCSTHASNGSRPPWEMSCGQRTAVLGCLPVQQPFA